MFNKNVTWTLQQLLPCKPAEAHSIRKHMQSHTHMQNATIRLDGLQLLLSRETAQDPPQASDLI